MGDQSETICCYFVMDPAKPMGSSRRASKHQDDGLQGHRHCLMLCLECATVGWAKCLDSDVVFCWPNPGHGYLFLRWLGPMYTAGRANSS